jgi:hypothetical protein
MRQLLTRLRRKRKPQSRARRIADWFATVVVLAYLVLLCVPQIVFAHSVSYRHFRVYSESELSPNIRSVLNRADQRLTGCEINEPKVVHRIFLCPNHASFAFFAPEAHDAFATNMPFLHNIFINTADVTNDTITTGAAKYGRRTLSGVSRTNAPILCWQTVLDRSLHCGSHRGNRRDIVIGSLEPHRSILRKGCDC